MSEKQIIIFGGFQPVTLPGGFFFNDNTISKGLELIDYIYQIAETNGSFTAKCDPSMKARDPSYDLKFTVSL